MDKKLIIGVVAVLIIVAGVAVATTGTPEQSIAPTPEQNNADNASTNSSEMVGDKEMSGDNMMNKDNIKSTEAATPGSYEAYSPEKIARATTGDVVIFFHASWCPSCRALGSDIEKNAAAIPAGVSILKADYDKEKDLKQKYGVTSQHTLVQVDAQGNLIKKWSGGSKLENLLAQIQ